MLSKKMKILLILLTIYGCQEKLPTEQGSSLSGKSVYLFSQTHTYSGAVGTSLLLIRGDDTVYSQQVISENGDFVFENLQKGMYDLILLTPYNYMPEKISEVEIESGNNRIVDKIIIHEFPGESSDSNTITVFFKNNIYEDYINQIISLDKESILGSYGIDDKRVYILSINASVSARKRIDSYIVNNAVQAVRLGAITIADNQK